jgi:hypothetical protein
LEKQHKIDLNVLKNLNLFFKNNSHNSDRQNAQNIPTTLTTLLKTSSPTYLTTIPTPTPFYHLQSQNPTYQNLQNIEKNNSEKYYKNNQFIVTQKFVSYFLDQNERFLQFPPVDVISLLSYPIPGFHFILNTGYYIKAPKYVHHLETTVVDNFKELDRKLKNWKKIVEKKEKKLFLTRQDQSREERLQRRGGTYDTYSTSSSSLVRPSVVSLDGHFSNLLKLYAVDKNVSESGQNNDRIYERSNYQSDQNINPQNVPQKHYNLTQSDGLDGHVKGSVYDSTPKKVSYGGLSAQPSSLVKNIGLINRGSLYEQNNQNNQNNPAYNNNIYPQANTNMGLRQNALHRNSIGGILQPNNQQNLRQNFDRNYQNNQNYQHYQQSNQFSHHPSKQAYISNNMQPNPILRRSMNPVKQSLFQNMENQRILSYQNMRNSGQNFNQNLNQNFSNFNKEHRKSSQSSNRQSKHDEMDEFDILDIDGEHVGLRSVQKVPQNNKNIDKKNQINQNNNQNNQNEEEKNIFSLEDDDLFDSGPYPPPPPVPSVEIEQIFGSDDDYDDDDDDVFMPDSPQLYV